MSKIFIAVMSSALLLTVMGASAFQCPMWREILPCKCRSTNMQTRLSISCENMASYGQVVDILRGHFGPNDRISLKLERSNLQDLQYRTFKELNVTLENLKLNHDYIGNIDENTFDGLTKVNYLSLADTVLEKIPEQLWKKMPSLRTVDIGRAKLKEISATSFDNLPEIKCIVLPGNQISRVDRGSIPTRTEKLHLGRNRIRHLNDTLTGLRRLGWLFVNANELEDLEGQLPYEAPDLKLIHASQNKLRKIPQQMKNYPALDTLFLNYNVITSLDGALSKSRELVRLVLEYNHIHTITPEDFQGLEQLETLLLGNNEITSLNNSLLTLKNLNFLNITYNRLTEFSFQEVIGLQQLRSIDLSYNQISNLVGPATNLVEPNIKLTELKLDNNLLETLNSALSGLPELLRLNLSFNKLRRISPDDFINLDQLRLLDISHNHITTLEEMSKTYLPRLSELKASHNYLTILEHDFHGLPVLCHADLSSNQVVALGRDLVTKTRCKIEHGVHEGTWDTLKIYLQDNPILCDAALPEITSAMEINHTRIYGVSHCPPLSEQPITPRPNGFLGFVPDQTTSGLPHLPSIYGTPAFDSKPLTDVELLETPNQIQPKIYSELREPAVELRTNDQYHTVGHLEGAASQIRRHINDEPIALTLQKPVVSLNNTNQEEQRSKSNTTAEVIDPIKQGKVINKLASEIEELRNRIDQLSAQQNELMLNKTVYAEDRSMRKIPKEIEDSTKP